MLFEQLFVQNLGAFRGDHRLELTPSDPARPVVLLGALNGSGKTTVIESLQLALYGKRASYGWRGVGGYPAYLSQIRNRNAPQTELTTAEVVLRTSDGRRLRVRRQWSFTKDSPREYLAVYVNDAEIPDSVLTESWDEEIERLLPARLSELFFFDGEKIEKLADPSRSGDVLRTAIASLMGLDLIDHLLGDLEILRSRVRQKFLAPAEKQQLEGVGQQERRVRQQLEDVYQERAGAQQRLDRVVARLEGAQSKLQREGGDRFQQRETLATQRATTSTELVGLQGRQREFAAGPFPLSLVLADLERLRGKVSDAVSSIPSIATVSAIRAEWQGLLHWVKVRPRWSKAARMDIGEYVRGRLGELELTAKDGIAAEGTTSAALVSRLIDQELPAAREIASRAVAEENELSEKLLLLDEQQRRMPEIDQLVVVLKDVSSAEEEQQTVQREMSTLDERERLCMQQLAVVSRERETLLTKSLVAEDAARTADYCDRSIATLKRYRATLIERRRRQLEALILEAFQVLLRKTDLVAAVTIDPDSMVVRLKNVDGLEIPAQQLSAGERQLLAIAILWGLAQASGRPVPVVIDTPLGRLDGDHRRALVERYFPDASHQVILLSTDKEVDSDFSELLDDAVAHRYLIDYNSKQKSSSFTPGYFQEHKRAIGNG